MRQQSLWRHGAITAVLTTGLLVAPASIRQFVSHSGADAAVWTIDTSSRSSVRAAYNGWLVPALSVPLGWTGNVGSCNAGTISAAAQQATLDAVNFHRAMASLPPVTFDATLSAKAQQAALMMSANDDLSHSPPTSWACYSAAGATAAGNSNLSLGRSNGAQAVTGGYMADPGPNNHAVGHRRWVLYPPALTMGSGTTSDSNALWVFGQTGPRPAQPTEVTWPSPGYFPVQLEPSGRWSFSMSGATFGNATVTVTGSNGRAVTATPYAPEYGYGDATLVWEVSNLNYGTGLPDETFHVTVANITTAAGTVSRSYDVTLFDANLATAPQTSAFVPLTPTRLLDTRSGGAPRRGPFEQIDLAVAGRGVVPATGVSAVVMNVTVTDPAGPGYVSVWPAGQARPTASNLNVNYAGETVANQVTVPVGSSGKVSLVAQPSAHLVADIAGYFTAVTSSRAGRFVSLAPARVFDTRAGSPMGTGATASFSVSGAGGVPTSGVSAVVMNVTTTNTTAPAYVTVWPSGAARPVASSLNVNSSGQTVPNQVTVPVGADGRVSIFTQRQMHALADIVGYYTDSTASLSRSGLFVPTGPSRLFDSRVGYLPTTRNPGMESTVWIGGLAGIPSAGAAAVSFNLTATDAYPAGYIAAWPGGTTKPTTSVTNIDRAGQTRATAATIKLGALSSITFMSQNGTELIGDVSGYYLA